MTDDPESNLELAPTRDNTRLIIGVSTRALFALEDANHVYEAEGLAAYRAYQRTREKDVLAPGTALPLVRDLLGVNTRTGTDLVEVVLLSRNDADSSMRVFNSIEALGLPITRGAFRGGRDPWEFLGAFDCDLFLSADPPSVKAALEQGFPAALVLRPPDEAIGTDQEVRIAFDGDGVLFDEESDRIYRTEGAEAYFRHEKDNADVPLSAGPFKPFLTALAAIQAEFKEGEAPVRTAIVTARNAPAHFRVVNTFRAWGVQVDEAFFVGPMDKSKIVSRLRPHIFLDDRLDNLEKAARDVPAAQIPSLGTQIELFDEEAAASPRRLKPTRTARAKAQPRKSTGTASPVAGSPQRKSQVRPPAAKPGRETPVEVDAGFESTESAAVERSRAQ